MIPRSKFNQAINTLNATKFFVGRKVFGLIPTTFAKKISPLIVPMETIILNTRRKSTRATPAAASRKNSGIYLCEQCVHLDSSKVRL